MIYIGNVVSVDTHVKVTIPALGGSGFSYTVKANPDEPLSPGDTVALDTINGSADEFYIVGKMAATVRPVYTPISNFTNLNDVQDNGQYVVITNTSAGTIVNIPEAKAGILQVYKDPNTSWLIQEYKVYSPGSGSGYRYSRGLSGSVWAPWQRSITNTETFGTQGTLSAALFGLDSRVTTATNLNATQNTRLDSVESVNTTQNGRLNTLETWKSATKIWSANTGPSHWDVPFASTTPSDIPGLTVTIPVTSTQDIYMVTVVLIVEYVSTDPTDGTPDDPVFNKMFEARLNISGTDSVEEINYRMPATANPVTGARSTLSRVYHVTSMAAGGRILKVRANQHAVGPNTQLRVHANSTIKAVRLN